MMESEDLADSFAVLLVVYFATVGLYTVAIAYVIRMLRRLEDRVKVLEEVLR